MTTRIFQIRKGKEPASETVASFEGLCLEFLQDSVGKRIVELDAFGDEIAEFTEDDCRTALHKIRPSPR